MRRRPLIEIDPLSLLAAALGLLLRLPGHHQAAGEIVARRAAAAVERQRLDLCVRGELSGERCADVAVVVGVDQP